MKSKRRPDNRGSVLILVMIAMSFISILGATILSATFTNYKIKVVDRAAKDNFYEAEAILDEIKAGLEAVSSEKAQAAYEKFLASYSRYATDAERMTAFANYYLNGTDGSHPGLIKALEDPAKAGNYSLNIIKGYIHRPENKTAFVTADSEAKLVVSGTDQIVLEKIKIAYTKNDYGTTLTTDIVMKVPDFKYNSSVASGGPEFGDYSLIADKKLSVLNGAIHTYGSVYAGEDGIEVRTPNLYTLAGDRVVTRGDISVVDQGRLKLGFEGLASLPADWNRKINWKPDVWAKNITTEGIGMATSPKLEMAANCYVGNDLKMNARNSEVKFNKGSQYVGYSHHFENATGGGIELNSDYSSAILMNGAKSTLDMSGLNGLVLPGRAFISKKTVEGSSGGAIDIMMGESVTAKQNQLAYLVPGKYMIDSIGTNPMKKEDFVSGSAISVNNLLKQEELDKAKILPYLDTTNMIKAIFPNPIGGAAPMAYCYFNFKSEEDANKYFADYYIPSLPAGGMEGSLSNFMAADGIKMKDADKMRTLEVAGAFMTYDVTKGYKLFTNTVTPSSLNFEAYQGYTRKYKNLTTTLTETTTGIAGSVFEELVKKSDLKSALAANGVSSYSETITIDGRTCGIQLVDNEGRASFAVNPATAKDGIIIATGDVTVEANFKGVILCGGEITMNMTGITTEADPSLVKKLLEYSARHSGGPGTINVAALFNSYIPSVMTVTSGAGSINVSQFICYENYEKNK